MSSELDAILERYSSPINRQLERQSEAMDRMAQAIADLARAHAVSEEKHANTMDTLRRFGKRIDDHESRLRGLETATAGNSFITRNLGQFTWVTVALVVGYLFKKLVG